MLKYPSARCHSLSLNIAAVYYHPSPAAPGRMRSGSLISLLPLPPLPLDPALLLSWHSGTPSPPPFDYYLVQPGNPFSEVKTFSPEKKTTKNHAYLVFDWMLLLRQNINLLYFLFLFCSHARPFRFPKR